MLQKKGLLARQIAIVAATIGLIAGGFFTTAAVYAEPAKAPELVGTFPAAQRAGDAAGSWTEHWVNLSGVDVLNSPVGLPFGTPVAVTIAERNCADDGEFMGSAVMTVHNVVVAPSGLRTLVNVQWPDLLCGSVKYSVGS